MALKIKLNLNLINNRQLYFKRNLSTTEFLQKNISSYDNPCPKDENVNFVKKFQKWQRVVPKTSGFDRDIAKLQKDQHFLSDPKKAKNFSYKSLQSFYDSLKKKGFAREIKPYRPPEDLNKKFRAICVSLFGDMNDVDLLEQNLSDLNLKFKLLVSCNEAFKHEINNADLYLIKTVKDVLDFYSIEIRGVNNLNSLANSNELPKNLHIITEYNTFNPDKNSFFDNLDAFPKKTLHRDGLANSKKYDVVKEEMWWPDV